MRECYVVNPDAHINRFNGDGFNHKVKTAKGNEPANMLSLQLNIEQYQLKLSCQAVNKVELLRLPKSEI